MKWIEILGPSGIGKTYLKQKLISKGALNDHYYTMEEALLITAIKAYKNRRNGFIDRFLGHYLQQNFFRTKKEIIFNEFLDNKKAYFAESDVFSYLIELNLNYYLKSDFLPIEKAYRITLFKGIIEKLSVLEYYKFGHNVLMDEGPFNHSHNFDHTLIDKKSKLPGGLIFCHADPKLIFERTKIRSEKGRTVQSHINLSDIKLMEHINKRYEAYLERKEKMMKYEIPFIEVNLENNVDINVVKTNTFLLLNK